MKLILFASTLLVAIVTATFAQSPLPTYPTLVDGNLINESDLTQVLTIPILAKHGRGLDFVANATLYGSAPSYIPVGGGYQWTLYGPTLVLPDQEGIGHIVHRRQSGHNGQCPVGWGGFEAMDSEGITHAFSIPDYVYPTNTCGLPTTGSGWAEDNSGYFATVDMGANTFNIYSPNGTESTGPLPGSNVFHQDANGNQVAFTYWSNVWTWTDTLGMTVLQGNTSNLSSYTYTYTGPSGNKTVTINNAQIAMQTSYGCPVIAETSGNVWVTTSVVYPDGSMYAFSYTADGRFNTVTLPTGGTISYSYPGAHNGIQCPAIVGGFPVGIRGGQSSSLNVTKGGGTWSYARSANTSGPIVTTISGPNGEKTVNTFVNWVGQPTPGPFAMYFPVQTKTYNGASLVRTVDVCYDGNTNPCTADINSLLSNVATTTLSSGLVSKVTRICLSNTYLPSSIVTYDFGPTLHDTESISYGSWNGSSCVALGNYISGRPCQVQVTDSGGNVVSNRLYTYDENALTSTGAPNLIQISGSRGNLTTYSEGGLTNKYSYFDTGSVQQFTDVNNQITTYNQTACGNSLPTQANMPLTLSESYAWESTCNGAVPQSETDPNGKTVSLTYNDPNFWRPTTSTDELNYPMSISYVYDGSNHPRGVETSFLFNNNNSTIDQRSYRDSYGRLVLDETLKGPNATNYDTVGRSYDSSGRINFISLPTLSSKDQLGGGAFGTTVQYDSLDRPTVATNGAGGTVTYCYYPSGNGSCSGTSDANDVLVTESAPSGENPTKRQYEYDGLGRLTSVCELSTGLPGVGTCGQTVPQTGYWTRYKYDVLGNLLGICQHTTQPLSVDCVQTPSAGQQTRIYTYDSLSRKTSETNPESGTVQMFYDTAPATPGLSCARSSFAGDLVKTYDANGNTVCYEYDALHRVTAIKHPQSCTTQDRIFVFDSATFNGQTMQNPAGRLAEAYTPAISHSVIGCGESGMDTSDTFYSYNARGELVTEYRSVPNMPGYSTFIYGYNEAGILNSFSTSISGVPSFAFAPNTQGEISQVTTSDPNNPALFTEIDYDSPGNAVNVKYNSNTQGDQFTYDSKLNEWHQGIYNIPNLTHANSVTAGHNTNGTVSEYSVSDANNPANSFDCYFTRDDVSRIASVGPNQSSCPWQQTFTYDPFGNITKSGTSSWIPGYDQTTNRYQLGGTSYDSNGNLLNDTFHIYTWDAENRPLTFDGFKVYYDAAGDQVGVQTASGYEQFFDTPVGRIITNSGGLVQARIMLPGGEAVVYGPSGLVGYLHPDWRGDFVLFSGPNGNYSSVAYAPFGENFDNFNNMTAYFMGLGTDTASGETDTQTRKYQWVSGRFIRPDPISSFDITRPQTLNKYVYLGNAPLESADPSGLMDAKFAADNLNRGESAFGGYWGETDSQYMARCCNGGNVSWSIPVGYSTHSSHQGLKYPQSFDRGNVGTPDTPHAEGCEGGSGTCNASGPTRQEWSEYMHRESARQMDQWRVDTAIGFALGELFSGIKGLVFARRAITTAEETYASVGGSSLNLTESMSRSALNKLTEDIAANGLKDKVINYVEIGGEKYVVNGNNRLMAARRLGITNQLRFQKVSLPFPGEGGGFRTEQDVINAWAEYVGGR